MKDEGGQCDAWFTTRGNTIISPNASRMSNANPADGRKLLEYCVYQYAWGTLATRTTWLLWFRSSSVLQVDFSTLKQFVSFKFTNLFTKYIIYIINFFFELRRKIFYENIIKIAYLETLLMCVCLSLYRINENFVLNSIWFKLLHDVPTFVVRRSNNFTYPGTLRTRSVSSRTRTADGKYVG